MSEKGRKSEDHSNLMKSSRGPAAASGLAHPGMVPHHSPYSLPTDGMTLHPSPHTLTYGIMRPSIGLRPGAMSNDLGPPIFMPSLNLGVPKQQPQPQQHASVSATQSSSAAQTNSKSKHNNLAQQQNAAAFDMIFPPVFHPAGPMAAGVPTSYIAHTAPHPSTMKPQPPTQQQATQIPSQPAPSPAASIAKPSPLPVAASASQKMGGVVRPTPKLSVAQSTPTSMCITSSNSKGEVPNANVGHMVYAPPGSHMGSPYLPAGHPGLMSTTHSPAMGTLSKMLMSPAVSQPSATSGGRQTKSQGTDIYGHQSVAQQGGSKSGAQKVASGYPNTIMDGYTLGGRGTLMGQMVASTLATSGQPTSTATYTDTKVERPPQPSATMQQQQSLPPSSTNLAPTSANASSISTGTSSRGGDKPLTTAEKASNIIISVPGLTGKHIAAITNNTATMQQSDDSTLSAYSSPISQPGIVGNHHSSVLAKSSSGPSSEYGGLLSQNQGMTPESTWGMHPQQKTNMIYHGGPLPPGHSNASSGQGFGGVPPATHIVGGGGVTTGASSSSHSLPPSGIMGSPGHTHSSPNSSPRPRILRTKRALDGSWKMEGQSNTAHSPAGSPHFSKLRQDLGVAKSVRSSSGYYGSGSYGNESLPMSPTSEGDTHHSNHLGSNKSDPIDLTASPRKKPRKQNVVANDDQYASNVPDGYSTKSSSEGGGGGGLFHLTEELKKPTSHLYNSVSTRNSSHKIKGEGNNGDTKEAEMYYLSQLRRCPYPINGVYKVQHKAARNHFRRHADIKHREEERISPFEIAHDRKSWQRSRGWKLKHFTTQLDEMLRVEEGVLKTMKRLEESVKNLGQVSTCEVDKECVETFKELLQGNIDRSAEVKSNIDNTRSEISKVLGSHHGQVLEILKKFAGKEPPHPLEQLGLLTENHRNKSHS